MDSFYITNARLAETLTPLNLLVINGIIQPEGTPVPDGIQTWDVRGALILPGLFDLHARLGEPGYSHRETILQGTEAAINGGFTGICSMADTKPAIDSAHIIRTMSHLSSAVRIPVHMAGCITQNAEGEQQASYATMAENGVKLLSDGRNTPQNSLLLRRAMQYAGEMGFTFAMRGEVRSLSGNAIAHESCTSYSLGLPSEPACSEEIGIATALSLATDTGASLHIQTLSTRSGLQAFKARKSKGNFTSEVALHHLIFSHEDIGDLDTNMKTVPPLRDREDAAALLDAVNEGIIDCIVSEHSPCSAFEKMQDFCSAPAGMSSLDTFLPVLYTCLVEPGKLSWSRVIEATSHNPRRILGLETANLTAGSPADFVLFQPDETTEVTPAFLKSKSKNTPWLNKSLKGRVVLVCKDTILKNELSA